MRPRRLIAGLLAVGVLATGPACAKKNEDKLALLKILQRSAHVSGVFRYSDQTPQTPFFKGSLVEVRGVVEDDFKYKARMSVDSKDVVDEVVSDDALAVRFVDPSFIPNYTGRGGTPEVREALNARYWITDPAGAPPVGGAALEENVLGVDPITDALSINDYVADAINQARGVQKFNTERIDYRPAEDPFPRPASGSGVTRWDLIPKDIPRADASEQAGGDVSLARIAVFRKMSIYVKDGRVVQVREQVAAKFDLMNKLRNYVERFTEKDGKEVADRVKRQLAEAAKDPKLLEATLNVALNQILLPAGEDPVRFRLMKYEFANQGQKQDVDLPIGTDVIVGNLSFFGANAAIEAAKARAAAGAGGNSNSITPATPTTTTTTTVAP